MLYYWSRMQLWLLNTDFQAFWSTFVVIFEKLGSVMCIPTACLGLRLPNAGSYFLC